ncbi:MAG: WD40 repeat domain-containing protein [Planctomycetaceae bacterium]
MRYAILCLSYCVSISQIAIGNELNLLQCKGDIALGFKYSPNGRWIVAGVSETGDLRHRFDVGMICIWDAQTRKMRPAVRSHCLITQAVIFAPQGQSFLSLGGDTGFCVWSIRSDPNSKVELLAPIVAGHHYPIRLPPTGKGDRSRTFLMLSGAEHADFAPLTREFATYSSLPILEDGRAGEQSIKFWVIPDSTSSIHSTPASRRAVGQPSTSIGTATPSSNASFPEPIANGGESSSGVGLKPRLTIPLDTRPVAMMTYSPNGKMILVGVTGHKTERVTSALPEIRFYDTESGKLERTWIIRDNDTISSAIGGALDFAPDGRHLLVCFAGKETVSVWNVESQQIVWTSPKADMGYCSGTFSPDGKLLALATNDHEVHLRRYPSFEIVSVGVNQSSATTLAFSPNAEKLVTRWKSNSLREWSVGELLTQKRWGLDKKPRSRRKDESPIPAVP